MARNDTCGPAFAASQPFWEGARVHVASFPASSSPHRFEFMLVLEGQGYGCGMTPAGQRSTVLGRCTCPCRVFPPPL